MRSALESTTVRSGAWLVSSVRCEECAVYCLLCGSAQCEECAATNEDLSGAAQHLQTFPATHCQRVILNHCDILKHKIFHLKSGLLERNPTEKFAKFSHIGENPRAS